VLERRTPLEQLSPVRNVEEIDGALFRVVPVTDRRLLLIQGDPEDLLLQQMVHRELGLDLPAPLTANARDGAALLWLAPKEWLLEISTTAAGHAQPAAAGALRAITDVSDAFAGFELGGSRAVEVLMSGCSLDLRPHAFRPGRVARTALAEVPAIICNMGPGPQSSQAVRLWVDRSFAAHLWDWLAESPSRW
jgi:heterotetrameric sarcosine oxidase gamma subunit